MESFKKLLEYEKELAELKIKTIKRFLKEKSKPIKRTSKINIVENILQTSGKPLHISEIIEIAKRDFNIELERDSIVSIIIKKMKKGQKFIRTGPNTFALKK